MSKSQKRYAYSKRYNNTITENMSNSNNNSNNAN